jgi:hypothetical protein
MIMFEKYVEGKKIKPFCNNNHYWRFKGDSNSYIILSIPYIPI